ncbi:unnamed protein product, partial [Polarella glacialis]
FELTATATQFPKRHAPEVTMQPSSDGGFWADGMAMSSTAPARLGMGSRQGTPIVPPLWEPHPRSDGFTAYGWKAGSEVTDSMADTSLYGTLLQDEDAVLPTFAPKFFAETQIPLSQRRDLVDPDAPTVKAPFSYRGAEYDDNRVPIFVPSSARAPGRSRQEDNFSPAKGSNLARGAGSASKEQLVDPKIISQLCSLLNPPDTPPSEYERIRQGPASAWASPEKVVKVGKDSNNTNSKLHRGEDVASLPLPVGIQAKPLGSAPQTKKEAESGLQDALSRLTRVLNMGADALMDTERSSSSTASWKRPLGASRHAPLIAEEEPDLRRELEGGMQQHLRRPTEAEISAMAGRIASAKRLDVAQEQQVRVMLRDIAESMFGEADSQGLASPEAKGRPPQLPAGGSGSRVGSSAHGPAQPHTARSSVKSMGSSNQSQDMDPVDTNEVLDLEVAGLMSELVGSLYAPAWESSSEVWILVPILGALLGFAVAAAFCGRRSLPSRRVADFQGACRWLLQRLQGASMEVEKTAIAMAEEECRLRKFVTSLESCPAAQFAELLPAECGYDTTFSKPVSSGRPVRFHARVEAALAESSHALELLTSPLTQRACVHWSAAVSRCPLSGLGSSGRSLGGCARASLAKGAVGVSFEVSLMGAPEVRVEVQGAEVKLFDMHEGSCATRQPFSTAPPRWRDFVLAHRDPDAAELFRGKSDPLEGSLCDFQEQVLVVGSQVTLVGELLRDASGRLSLQPWQRERWRTSWELSGCKEGADPTSCIEVPRVLISDDPALLHGEVMVIDIDGPSLLLHGGVSGDQLPQSAPADLGLAV